MNSSEEQKSNETLRRVLTKYGHMVSPANVDDQRIDGGAQQAILSMARGATVDQVYALAILAGVKSDRLSGIFGDDSDVAAQMAATLNVPSSRLIPENKDATLVLSPDTGIRPTLIFRAQIRFEPSRLEPSLRGVIDDSRNIMDELVTAKGEQTSKFAADDQSWSCAIACAACALIDVGCGFCQACMKPPTL